MKKHLDFFLRFSFISYYVLTNFIKPQYLVADISARHVKLMSWILLAMIINAIIGAIIGVMLNKKKLK